MVQQIPMEFLFRVIVLFCSVYKIVKDEQQLTLLASSF